MRTSKQITKEDIIDLSIPEEERWTHVIKKEKLKAKALVASAMVDFPQSMDFLSWPFAAA